MLATGAIGGLRKKPIAGSVKRNQWEGGDAEEFREKRPCLAYLFQFMEEALRLVKGRLQHVKELALSPLIVSICF